MPKTKHKTKAKKKGARRYKIKGKPKHYAHRDRLGRFTRWVGIGRSMKRNKLKKVGSGRIPKTKTGKLKPGYGHKGDYPKRR